LHGLLNQILTFRWVYVKHISVKPQNRRRLVTPETSRLLEGYPHHLSNLGPLLNNINPNDFSRARCRFQDRAENHQKSSLARAVRPQNYHSLALVDGKVQATSDI